MAVQKLLTVGANNLPTNYTPVTTSSGSASAGQIPALSANGTLDPSMLPASNGMPSLTVTASEAIAAGALCSLYDNSGTLNVRNANATDATKPANCFAPSAIASAASGSVSFGGAMNSGAASLTIGAAVYLSAATAGASTATAPTASGNLLQIVGYAISATEYNFQPQIVAVL